MRPKVLLFALFPLSQALALGAFLQAFGRLNVPSTLGFLVGIAADIALLYVLVQGLGKEKAEARLEEMKLLGEAERSQREMLEERQASLQTLRGQLTDQLIAICGKLENGEAASLEADMQQMQEQLEQSRTERYCGNFVVNAVLSEKQKQCRERGFSMDIRVRVPERLAVEPLDLCSVFSNLLDNAIEAAESLPPEKRRIAVRSAVKGSYLAVRAENAAKSAHALRGKRNGRGYGTQILAEIAEKYDGEYQASYEKGTYTALLTLKAGGEGAVC